MRVVESCMAEVERVRVIEKVDISVAEAANCRTSELMSCTAWRTCAPDQESILDKYDSELRVRARSSSGRPRLLIEDDADGD